MGINVYHGRTFVGVLDLSLPEPFKQGVYAGYLTTCTIFDLTFHYYIAKANNIHLRYIGTETIERIQEAIWKYNKEQQWMKENPSEQMKAVSQTTEQPKLRLDLIPPEFIDIIGQVLTEGAQHHGDTTWEGNVKVTKHLASLKRHLLAYEFGHDIDPESSLHAMGHVAVRALMLYTIWFRQQHHLDDRRNEFTRKQDFTTVLREASVITPR